MSRQNNLLTKDGTLKIYAVEMLYNHCVRHCAERSGYVKVTYANMARLLRLPWIFAGCDNAETIRIVRNGLARLQTAGLIKMKTAGHWAVLVRLTEKTGCVCPT